MIMCLIHGSATREDETVVMLSGCESEREAHNEG